MGNVVIAVVGGDSGSSDVLYRGLKSFPADKLVLLHEPRHRRAAETIKKDLAKFRTPVSFVELRDVSFESLFKTVADLRDSHSGERVIINTDTDARSSCVALSAAFVNGIQAIGVLDDKTVAYPIMKFSYYSALSDKKMGLLKLVSDAGVVPSLEDLSRRSGMSLPLVMYHVRGSKGKQGLEDLGLVETRRDKGRLSVRLTALGGLIVSGLVETQEPARQKKR